MLTLGITRELPQHVEGCALHIHGFLGLAKKDIKGVGDRAIVNDLLKSTDLTNFFLFFFKERDSKMDVSRIRAARN